MAYTESDTATDGLVWVNGIISTFSAAKVSLEDRGFEFADGIYEVARVYNGKTLAWQEHMARLESSAAGIELTLPMSIAEITELSQDLLKKTGLHDAEIYMQFTRGATRRNH